MESRQLKPVLFTSDDGSHSLRIDELNENYHSHKGALKESLHVFIDKGLKPFGDTSSIRILEVGFGTGLNALLTALYAIEKGIHIHYTTLEAYPLSQELTNQLNYPTLLSNALGVDIFKKLHECAWGTPQAVTESFTLTKYHVKLEDFTCSGLFDLVYYDAFAPHAQPELWTPVIWEKIYNMLEKKGKVVTYCAKGQVRRDLNQAGFEVERLEGPPGKREMLRATK